MMFAVRGPGGKCTQSTFAARLWEHSQDNCGVPITFTGYGPVLFLDYFHETHYRTGCVVVQLVTGYGRLEHAFAGRKR